MASTSIEKPDQRLTTFGQAYTLWNSYIGIRPGINEKTSNSLNGAFAWGSDNLSLIIPMFTHLDESVEQLNCAIKSKGDGAPPAVNELKSILDKNQALTLPVVTTLIGDIKTNHVHIFHTLSQLAKVDDRAYINAVGEADILRFILLASYSRATSRSLSSQHSTTQQSKFQGRLMHALRQY